VEIDVEEQQRNLRSLAVTREFRHGFANIALDHSAALGAGDHVVAIRQFDHAIEVPIGNDFLSNDPADPGLWMAVLGRQLGIAPAALETINTARAVAGKKSLKKL